MTIKHGKLVTYCIRLPPIKSHNPLNTWYFEIPDYTGRDTNSILAKYANRYKSFNSRN